MNKDFFVLKYDKINIKRNYPGLLVYFDEPSGLLGKNPCHLYLLKNKSELFIAFTHYKPSMLNMWDRAKFEEIIYHSYMAGEFTWHSIAEELFPLINEFSPKNHYQNYLIGKCGFSAYLLMKDYCDEQQEEHVGDELSNNYGVDFMIFVDKVVCNTIAKKFFPNNLDIIGPEDRYIWGSDLEKDVAKISIIALTECPNELIENLNLVIDKDDEALVSYIVNSSRGYMGEMKYLFGMQGLKSEIFG